MNENNNIPKLGNGLKQNPFSTPKGYFDCLPSLIQERCAAPEAKKNSWIKALVPQLGFVVGFVALVLIAKGFFGVVTPSLEVPKDSVAQVADTVMYYDENGELLFIDEAAAIDDAIISYLVDNKVNDLDIVQ